MAGIKNIIRKQTVHFHYNGQVDGFALQKEVSDWCTHTLIPQLERQLEPYCMPHLHMVLDKLELAATINGSNWQEQIQQQVIAALQTKLAQEAINLAATDGLLSDASSAPMVNFAPQQIVPPTTGGKVAPSQMPAPDASDSEAASSTPAAKEKATEKQIAAANTGIAKKQTSLVLFFLQHGYLPWWSNTILATPFAAWLPQWLTGHLPSDAHQPFLVQTRVQQLVQQVKALASDTARDRLVQHLPLQHYQTFVQWAFPEALPELGHIQQLVSALPTLTANRTKFTKVLEQVQQYWLAEKIGPVATQNAPSWMERLHQAIQPAQANKKLVAVSTISVAELPATVAANNPMAQKWQQWVAQKQAVQQASIPNNIPLATPQDQPTALEQKTEPSLLTNQPIGETRDKKAPISETVKPATPKAKASDVQAEWQEGIFIENAGAVIIAPFLPMLFNTLKWTKNGILQQPGKAACLIQYMVTGNTAIGEADLVLPKILCGLEPDELVNTAQKITAQQKKEVQELLASVVAHWSILKNTSTEGLQQSFLQRHGKLVLTNNQWLLQVEQKSFDMLVQQLPWNINMIKLPWMKQMLRTEWV